MAKTIITLTTNLPWRRAGREAQRRAAMAQVAGAKDARLVGVRSASATTQFATFEVTS